MHEHEDHIHEEGVTHEHTHTHTYAHSHEHTHAHDHEHDHDHTHPHEHPHSHEAAPTQDGSMTQTLALLRYMLEHNRSHAEEVKALIPKLTEQGLADAAMMLDSCVSSYHDGNEWLAAALRKLEKHGA